MAELARLRRVASTCIGSLRLRRSGVGFGSELQLHGVPIVSRAAGASITLGNRIVLTSDSRATALGVRSPVILRCLTADASIFIDDDCGLSGTVICAAVAVSIGKRCLIGADCMIFDTDFHNVEQTDRRYSRPDWPSISAPVAIGDDVFIGARSIIAKGVKVGSGSVIAAGSVVVCDVPPMSVFGGSPARMLKSLVAVA